MEPRTLPVPFLVEGKQRMFNAHAHCFTIDHVPDYFSRGYTWLPIRISTIKKYGIIEWAIKNLPKMLTGDGTDRLINLVRYMDLRSQEDIFQFLMSYYPPNTGMVLLTMDMEYMQAEAPFEKFEVQLARLGGCKQRPEFRDVIFPFIFVDPRRVDPRFGTWETAVEKSFIGQKFLAQVRSYIEQGIFQGIKLYPAIGYFPFDKRLRPIYDLALEYDLPVISHVIQGVVHFRGDKEYQQHPFTGKPLPGKKPKDFSVHFTHPLNFEILLNPAHLSKHWNITYAEAEKYSNLKICLGHFGGDDEWSRFVDDPWLPASNAPYASLSLQDWTPGAGSNYSWFSVCCDLMRKYPQVYADISYTASKPLVFPLLKVILESDERIRQRTLFGTDFYVVAKVISERGFSLNVRAALGEELYREIAYNNPVFFLNSRKSLVCA